MSKNPNNSEDRLNFLNESQAIPTPIEAMAIWVAVWMDQGGKIDRTKFNYEKNAQMVRVIKLNSIMPIMAAQEMGFTFTDFEILDMENISYENFGHSNWTPTLEGVRVPEGYGSMKLDLLVMNPVASVSAFPHSQRRGWEFGHSTVRILDGNIHDGFTASTNESMKIKVPDDVYKLATQRDAIKVLSAALATRVHSEKNSQISE